MTRYLKLKKSNCKNCYKCIRHCPVKSIKFSNHQANIVDDECILCGQCFVNCPQNAKEIRNDTEAARALIASGAPVYVSLAPSFVANYPGVGIGAMEKALQKLGFAAVEETAIGATLVKREYERLVKEGEQEVIISSCCHSVNLLIQKYYPEALPYLAKVESPMLAHCRLIKEQHPGAKTVFIGPCISKKAEAETYAGIVDCVLTFEELTEWMNGEQVTPEPEQEKNEESRARLFPTSGGILRTMDWTEDNGYSRLTIDGTENCIHALKEIMDGTLSNCFIEMSACAGSCVGGPVMEKTHRSPVRDFLAVDRYAGKKDFVVQTPENSLTKEIPYLGLNRQMPGSRAIEEILCRMGKTSPADELNCGSCGYDTCREKAVAVYWGKADLTMCLPFLKEKAETFSDTIIRNSPNGIIVLNESLEVQQINGAACDILRLSRPADIMGDQVVRVLDPQIFFEVIQTGRDVRDKRMFLAEYEKYVEMTVIYDKSYRVLLVLMRDITEEEHQRAQKENVRKQTVEITDQVVAKQMRIVQEIASLLGETTAETKIALTNLKEYLNDE